MLVHLNNIEVMSLPGHNLIGSIPIGGSLIAKLFRLPTDPYAVPFWEIGGHPPSLIVFMRQCLLHENHSRTCKSKRLLTPLEVVSGVLGNPLRLSKRGALGTVVFTKHNLVRRIT